jgi:hypothetical protein
MAVVCTVFGVPRVIATIVAKQPQAEQLGEHLARIAASPAVND